MAPPTLVITSVQSTTSGKCNLLLTVANGPGAPTLTVDAAALAGASFDTANGATLAKLKGSRVYREFLRPYGTSAEAAGAAAKFLVAVAPAGVVFTTIQCWAAYTGAGPYYPAINFANATVGAGEYLAQIVRENSITL